ncbi:MAG: cyclic pyranopterin monophosphate synthase MoaC [Candidatus Eremiobacteraeota bacterium]|nr:cyclic pyranopterin monophosphate synthase MoaC [Candidatus Eremiobacteraeota bacterium]
MVDVSEKQVTTRLAVAESWVRMSTEAFQALVSDSAPKGDVLATVRLAAVMAVKKTSDLIPLCHPLAVEKVSCEVELHEPDQVRIEVTARISGKTGVEMEALTGASIGALTLYDMLKALDKGMTIGPTRLRRKTGGKSGDYEQ